MPDPANQLRSGPRRRARRYVAAMLLLAALCVWLVWFFVAAQTARRPPSGENDGQNTSVEEPDRFALPAISAARFRNASRDVAYVGNPTCRKCHPDEHASYRHTKHSRSLSEVDVSREPPDGEIHHDLSGRHYRVYRDGKTLRLREFIRDSRGGEVVLGDHAARYALGSNNHSRMYLIQHGDFLVESPVTWYPRRKLWGMSAGYEKNAHQLGFSREVAWGCLNCHSGRTEAIGESNLRLRVVELAISCERCHGPGALHVAERRANRPVRGKFDDSIVNLRHLPRDRQEDVCSQCHLSTIANVAVRGRRMADFRPGMTISDFRIGYRIDRLNSGISVSDQVRQMRQSRCYTESKTLTCTTCHNLHSALSDAEKFRHDRKTCLGCHETKPCGLPARDRQNTRPSDNCMACHMPKSRTDIPHLSFSHHRIGIHSSKRARTRFTDRDRLVPVVDVSRFPEHERLRQLGLANAKFAENLFLGLDDESRDDPSYRELAAVFANRGRTLLDQVQALGLQDPVLDAYFSRQYWRKNSARCIKYAESALNSPQIPPGIRIEVLHRLATSHFDEGRYEQAMPYLQKLVTEQRDAIPLMLLAICYRKNGQLPRAVRLIEQAILAEPTRADLHSYLASVYRELGKPDEAARHLERAKLLMKTVPQPK